MNPRVAGIIGIVVMLVLTYLVFGGQLPFQHQYLIKAVFSEAQFSPKLTQSLAQEAGVQQVVADLYNDSLGDAPADTYLGMMRYNVQRIVQALA